MKVEARGDLEPRGSEMLLTITSRHERQSMQEEAQTAAPASTDATPKGRILVVRQLSDPQGDAMSTAADASANGQISNQAEEFNTSAFASDGNEMLKRLASSLHDQFSDDLLIQVIQAPAAPTQSVIEVRNQGVPAWTACVSQRPSENNAHQILVETCIEVFPHALQSLDEDALLRLTANENLGLRGVSVVAEIRESKRILRLRSTYLTQAAASRDEDENMAIDLMTCLRYAQTLEDRITGCSVAGQFSFELYATRHEQPGRQPVRYTTESSSVFNGSTERVFGQVCEILTTDFSFQVNRVSAQTAMISMPGADLQIVGKIPEEIPMFTCSAPLIQMNDSMRFQDRQIWSMLNELNAQSEHGHFEFNPFDRVLSFASWKHLTNDLRHSSFDHVVLAAVHAFTKAQNMLLNAPERVHTPTSEIFIHTDDSFLNDDDPPPSGKIEIPRKAV